MYSHSCSTAQKTELSPLTWDVEILDFEVSNKISSQALNRGCAAGGGEALWTISFQFFFMSNTKYISIPSSCVDKNHEGTNRLASTHLQPWVGPLPTCNGFPRQL